MNETKHQSNRGKKLALVSAALLGAVIAVYLGVLGDHTPRAEGIERDSQQKGKRTPHSLGQNPERPKNPSPNNAPKSLQGVASLNLAHRKAPERASLKPGELEGLEAWNKPALEHCKRLLHPRNLKAEVPMHVFARKQPDGTLAFEVDALGGCAPQDLLDFTDLQMRPCEEGQKPDSVTDIAKCESARINYLQKLPKSLSAGEDGRFEYYYFHTPDKAKSAAPLDKVELPPVEKEVQEAGAAELPALAHTIRLGNSDSEPKLELVVCADYERFSRNLFENLKVVLAEYPQVQVSWVLRPLPNDVSGMHLALASAAAAELGFGQEAQEILFDLRDLRSLNDVTSALGELDVSSDEILKQMNAPKIRQRVANGIHWCEKHGISSTPGLLLGDKTVIGTRTPEQLRALFAETTSARPESLR